VDLNTWKIEAGIISPDRDESHSEVRRGESAALLRILAAIGNWVKGRTAVAEVDVMDETAVI
jgi:hypothetical protein